MFADPEDVSKRIYTINVIESLNSFIRRSVKTRRIFTNDAAGSMLNNWKANNF
ncbi:MAG: transposase [Psychromonas sp.]|nr:transposase [Psychromonas sp.]